MTVNNVENVISYAANGSTTEWVFPFPAVSPEHIEVFVTSSIGNAVQIPVSLYDVILDPLIGANPTSQSGKVIFPNIGAPLAVGNQITIVRNLPAVQPVSISNQSIIYPPIIEQEFDYLTLLTQNGQQDISRAFKVGLQDPIPALVPPVAQRASKNAFFDSLGNLTPGTAPGPGVFISAAMQPVVEAATLALARQLMGISPVPLDVSGTFVVTESNDRQVLNLTGDFYTVTLGDPTGLPDAFWVAFFNSSERGKLLSPFGKTAFMLWPRQFVWMFNTSAGWSAARPGRWKANTFTTFFVHPTQGNDTNDGLAPGIGAFQTIQRAISVLEDECDGDFQINLADGNYNVGTGLVCRQPLIGSPDGYSIIGNIANPGNVVINCNTGATVLVAENNAVVTLQGFRCFAGAAGVGNGIICRLGAVLYISNVIFGQVSGVHMEARSNGTLNVIGPYTIIGSCDTHLNCVSTGTVVYTPGVVTIGNALTVGNFFVCQAIGIVHSRGITQSFVNPSFVTGIQYNVSYNAVVAMNGTVLPGTIAGTAALGGFFV